MFQNIKKGLSLRDPLFFGRGDIRALPPRFTNARLLGLYLEIFLKLLSLSLFLLSTQFTRYLTYKSRFQKYLSKARLAQFIPETNYPSDTNNSARCKFGV